MHLYMRGCLEQVFLNKDAFDLSDLSDLQVCYICQICQIFWIPQLKRAKCETDQRTDQGTDRPTDQQTDRPSYRDAWTHLKRVIKFKYKNQAIYKAASVPYRWAGLATQAKWPLGVMYSCDGWTAKLLHSLIEVDNCIYYIVSWLKALEISLFQIKGMFIISWPGSDNIHESQIVHF